MKLAITSDPGCISFLCEELKQRFNTSPVQAGTHAEISVSEEKAARIMYSCQSARRTLLLLCKGKATTLEELNNSMKEGLEKQDLKSMAEDNTVRVVCERHGEHDYNSVEAEKTGFQAVKEKTGCKADLKNPWLQFYLLIQGDEYVFGADLAGRDLGKRHYKVFTNPVEVRGTIAFSFLVFSGYKPGMTLADPFALSGTIPIEAALYNSGVPVNYYDKSFAARKTGLISSEAFEKTFKKADSAIQKPGKPSVLSMDPAFRNVSAQKKNAKIAGVEKHIAFSRTDADWLDIKLKERKASLICTKPLEPSKSVPERKARDSYKALFKRARDALEEKGLICLITTQPAVMLEEAKTAGYKEKETRIAWQGKKEIFFTKLEPIE